MESREGEMPSFSVRNWRWCSVKALYSLKLPLPSVGKSERFVPREQTLGQSTESVVLRAFLPVPALMRSTIVHFCDLGRCASRFMIVGAFASNDGFPLSLADDA
jgi:hypothetical protein